MNEAEFSAALSRCAALRKPDWQGPGCAPRKKPKLPAAAHGSGAKPSALPKSLPASSGDFWARLDNYAVSKGLSAVQAAKLVQAAKTIFEQEKIVDAAAAENNNDHSSPDASSKEATAAN